MNEEISHTWRDAKGKRVSVVAEPSLRHANVCRFVVDPPLYPEGGAHFTAAKDAAASPLAEAIFELGDVIEVLIAGNSLSVTTEEAKDWKQYSETIVKVIREQINSGFPAVSDSFTKSLPPPEVIRERVQEIIETAINPAVASHGGVVTLLGVQGNNVFLEFGGGCQGCGMVSVTLKHGVERVLRERVPEIGEILDTTDHAAGTNPYYAPAAK